MDAGGLCCLFRLLIRRAIFAGCVALGCLLFDEFVVDVLRCGVINGRLRFGAGVQRGAPAAVGEGDDVAAVLGFDGRLIDFVG